MGIATDPIFAYCIIVLIVGFAALIAIYRFGKTLLQINLVDLSRNWGEVFDLLLKHYQSVGFRSNIPQHFVNANAEWLQKRNEFWTTYVQVMIAALIIIILAVLLITKTINPEAGLPILSAVSGFAIAKSASTNRIGSNNDNDRPQ
jgi:hypothetical protein